MGVELNNSDIEAIRRVLILVCVEVSVGARAVDPLLSKIAKVLILVCVEVSVGDNH